MTLLWQFIAPSGRPKIQRVTDAYKQILEEELPINPEIRQRVKEQIETTMSELPLEVTDAVLFLCSEHAGFITGSCLRVDGGHSAMGPQGKEVVLPTMLRKGTAAAQPKN
mgnify:CR=1 FL=1